jgi:Secretion system C-terminal sorting domain
VNVNFTLYPGNDYFIKCRGYVDLYRNSSGAAYPYSSSLINITNSNAGSPGYYYFFYNWTYTEVTCNTSRTAVTAQDTCTVGITEIPGLQSLEIFPNPNDGVFDLKFESRLKENYTVEITNAVGQVIYREDIIDFSGLFNRKLDISKSGAGIYLLTVSASDNRAIRKLIVR